MSTNPKVNIRMGILDSTKIYRIRTSFKNFIFFLSSNLSLSWIFLRWKDENRIYRIFTKVFINTPIIRWMKLAPSFFFIFTEIWLQMLPPAIPGDLTLYERLLSAGSKGSDLCWAQFETTVKSSNPKDQKLLSLFYVALKLIPVELPILNYKFNKLFHSYFDHRLVSRQFSSNFDLI